MLKENTWNYVIKITAKLHNTSVSCTYTINAELVMMIWSLMSQQISLLVHIKRICDSKLHKLPGKFIRMLFWKNVEKCFCVEYEGLGLGVEHGR